MVDFKTNYLPSIKEHINQCLEELDELQSILLEREWTRAEYRASERLLQVLIESLIGVGKQWLKSLNKHPLSDAYQTMEKLVSLQKIPDDLLTDIKKMIGLRNAIVHDYLNIDQNIVKSVVKNKYYSLVTKIVDLI